MKLIIDIPDEMWEQVKDGYVPLGISKYLKNGIPYEGRTQGEWVRKEDIIHLLERWADGYSYIEIPTEDAIKAIKELNG